MNNTVFIDTNKLYSELSAQNKTKSGFSLEIGRGKSYIENLKRSPNIPEGMERVISIMLGKEPGYFIQAPEPEEKTVPTAEAQILVNAVKEIKQVSGKLDKIIQAIEEMDERQQKIWSKVQANTLQLEAVKERTKECVEALKLTDYDKAVKFLRETLSGGRMIGEEVIRMADAAGIKRADLNKAKRDIQVDTSTTGYGKSQKTWWFLAD